jgi:hypothetical protein
LIGYADDAGSGAGFDYPSPMTVTMNAPCPEKTPPFSEATEN